MAKITDELKSKIIAQYRIGKSQNWLSREYELSPATINKLCKGVPQDLVEKVNTQIAIKSQLASESEYISEYFDKEVNEQLRNKNLVYGVTHKALLKANALLDTAENMYDINTAIQLADRASLTLGVNPRHASNQVNIQNNQSIEPTKIIREIIDVIPRD